MKLLEMTTVVMMWLTTITNAESSSNHDHKVSPISLKLESQLPADDWVHVNFYGDKFAQFYQCLSGDDTLTCIGALARDDKQPFSTNDRRVVNLDKQEVTRPSDLHSDFFSCGYDFLREKVTCERMDSPAGVCDANMEIQHFRMLGDDSSALKCVGFIWKSSDESLIFNRVVHNIQLCNSTCNMTRVEHESSDHHRSSEEVSEWHNNFPHWGYPRVASDSYQDRKTHIIIVVVAVIAVLAIVTVAAGIFRRKLMKMKNTTPTHARGDNNKDRRSTKRKTSTSSRSFNIEIPAKSTSVSLNPSHLHTDI